jgi:hypothetical protein
MPHLPVQYSPGGFGLSRTDRKVERALASIDAAATLARHSDLARIRGLEQGRVNQLLGALVSREPGRPSPLALGISTRPCPKTACVWSRMSPRAVGGEAEPSRRSRVVVFQRRLRSEEAAQVLGAQGS